MPELPGPRNKHQYRDGNLEKSPNNFPYPDVGSEDNLSDKEIDIELGLNEFFVFPTINAPELTLNRRKYGSQDAVGGKAKSFANYIRRPNDEKLSEKDKTHAIDVSYMNYNPDEDYEEIDKYIEESRLGRDPGQFNTSNISTKQPWANGLPRGKDPFHWYEDEEEDDLDMNLNGLFEYQWGTTAFSVMSQSKKYDEPEEDLHFFDSVDENPYLCVTQNEFEQNEKERKVKNEK